MRVLQVLVLLGWAVGAHDALRIIAPAVVLRGVAFRLEVALPRLRNGSVYSSDVWLEISTRERSDGHMHIYQKQLLRLPSVNRGIYPSDARLVLPALRMNESGPQHLQIICSVQTTSLANRRQKLFLRQKTTLFVTPGWLALLPPLVTLLFAAVVKQVMVALLLGIWCGATIITNGNVFSAFMRTFDTFFLQAFTNDGHAGILLFTILLGGVIGLVQKCGGGHGLALLFLRLMTSRLKMQLYTWILCLLIFFDDYSCILIIGSSLRNVLTETRVSAHKFAAIIHGVGVCLPSIAPVSAWIGVEIGYIAAQLNSLGLEKQLDPFMICLESIPFRFFPVLMLCFLFILILFKRDFGPMLKYEQSVANQESSLIDMEEESNVDVKADQDDNNPLSPPDYVTAKWYNAAIPFLTVVVVTFSGMVYDGYSKLKVVDPGQKPTLLLALSHSDSVMALIRSAATGCFVCIGLLLIQPRQLSLNECLDAWVHGVKDILEPTIVLLLAWALGTVIGEVQVATYLSSFLSSSLNVHWLPFLSTLLSFVVSFATGSGFGTMAILFPIIAPLSFSLSGANTDNLIQCFGSILGGATFGNLCSPIADTSILTSMSAHVELTEHIKSFTPYCLLVALISLFGGILPVGLQIYSWFTAYAVCLALLIISVMILGTTIQDEEEDKYSYPSPPQTNLSSFNIGEEKPLLS